MIKTFDFVIRGENVSMPRDRWELTKDAVPTKFPGIPHYLSSRVPKKRKVSTRNTLPVVVHKKSRKKTTELIIDDQDQFNKSPEQVTTAACTVTLPPLSPLPTAFDHSYAAKQNNTAACDSCREIKNTNQRLRRKVCRQMLIIRQLRGVSKKLRREKLQLSHKLSDYAHLSPKTKLIVSEAIQKAKQKVKTTFRYSDEWILDSLLIRCKSTSGYNMLRNNGYLPLPSLSTLNRAIQNLRPEFGFDNTLFDALKDKLSNFELNERRGILMFDEMQISKNIEFRVDTCRLVGMVDFGELTTNTQRTEEGDHALVFLFQPHLGGWVQTVGCFCSHGTTPTSVLAKLILQCVILLERCGAVVDGLVSDGASTNRAALASMGFCGEKGRTKNKMVNPHDSSRDIYFFCDAPHLLKTVRNNLIRAKEFLTPSGVVQLQHYAMLLALDLNPSTGLRAVPKLTQKHVHPNNFQKMSVRIAAQLFSKSVADGLQFYKSHSDKLRDVDPTITFTRKMNDIFDLLNGRRPVDGIRLNSSRDRLQELHDASRWLDDWETYVLTLPVAQQKQFLSRQTCQGLRITLKSAIDLSRVLLHAGFSYVLTGKFNQDPLETVYLVGKFLHFVLLAVHDGYVFSSNHFLLPLSQLSLLNLLGTCVLHVVLNIALVMVSVCVYGAIIYYQLGLSLQSPTKFLSSSSC